MGFISTFSVFMCAVLYANADLVHDTQRREYGLVTRLVSPTTIEFQLTVVAQGWVGIGVGPNPNMENADLAIITQDPNNSEKGIIKDYHDILNRAPIADTKTESDWTLSLYVSNSTTRTIHVRRLLKTTDPNVGQDLEITTTPMHLLWSYGTSDSFDQHIASGSVGKVNLVVQDGVPGGASAAKKSVAFLLGSVIFVLAKLI